MIYVPTLDGHVPWYVELSEHVEWSPCVTKGITAPQLLGYTTGVEANGAVSRN